VPDFNIKIRKDILKKVKRKSSLDQPSSTQSQAVRLQLSPNWGRRKNYFNPLELKLVPGTT
jgi:hypothetical protein